MLRIFSAFALALPLFALSAGLAWAASNEGNPALASFGYWFSVVLCGAACVAGLCILSREG